jgi:hypothetical protein
MSGENANNQIDICSRTSILQRSKDHGGIERAIFTQAHARYFDSSWDFALTINTQLLICTTAFS